MSDVQRDNDNIMHQAAPQRQNKPPKNKMKQEKLAAALKHNLLRRKQASKRSNAPQDQGK